MIIYLLLKAVLAILNSISVLFGSYILGFPDEIKSVLDSINIMINGGISFLSYFFYVPVVVALITLVISWHGFRIIKDAVMKVIGHFFGN